MNCPFPGMDPYLERHWGDVHTRLMVYASNQLNEQLPDDLRVRVEKRVSVDVDPGVSGTIFPDVRIVEEDVPSAGAPASATMTETIAEPLVITLTDEVRSQRHLEIVDQGDQGRVITAIEFLSPWNKDHDAGRRAYRRKQGEYLSGGVNLVEVDLVRAGDFVLAVPESLVPQEYLEPYLVCIRPATDVDYSIKTLCVTFDMPMGWKMGMERWRPPQFVSRAAACSTGRAERSTLMCSTPI